MSYLDMLKSLKRRGGVPTKPTEPPSISSERGRGVPTEPTEPPFDGFVGMHPGHSDENYPPAFTSRQWVVSFPNKDDMQVLYVGGASFEKVLSDYPKACAAQPVTPDQCCLACTHYASPGMSEGYCGGRDDLPSAYGEGHPLRKLPEDNGAICEKWAPFW